MAPRQRRHTSSPTLGQQLWIIVGHLNPQLTHLWVSPTKHDWMLLLALAFETGVAHIITAQPTNPLSARPSPSAIRSDHAVGRVEHWLHFIL